MSGQSKLSCPDPAVEHLRVAQASHSSGPRGLLRLGLD
jgi:hypothetical protein